MKKLSVFLAGLLLAGLTIVQAQTVRITGTVTSSEDGMPMPGVSVVVQGTTIGITTNADGKYELNVPATAQTLTFSFVGYKTVDVPIAGRSVIDVAMETEAVQMGEVVVTALGITRQKKALGYTVQDVKGDDLVKANNPNVMTALSGKVAGVEIRQSSGMPGAPSTILIRGARSFSGNNQPLYVVDGMPIASNADYGQNVTGAAYSNRALDIDPNEIESINVLKGQAAAALYGTRASNGVIVITTKKGKGAELGKPVVTVTSNVTMDVVARLPEVNQTFAQGYYWGNVTDESDLAFIPAFSYSWGPRITELPNNPYYGGVYAGNVYDPANHSGEFFDPYKGMWVTPKAYNNAKEFYSNNGYTYNNSINISNATKFGNYSVGLGATNQNGIIAKTGMDRYNAKMAGDFKLADKWDVGFSGNYVDSKIRKVPSGNSSWLFTVYGAPASFDLMGTPYHQEGPFGEYRQISYRRGGVGENPRWAIENNIFQEQIKRFFGNAYVQFKPFAWSTIKYQLGVDTYTNDNLDLYQMGSTGTGQTLPSRTQYPYPGKVGDPYTYIAPVGGSINQYGVTRRNINSLLTMSFDHKFTEDLNANLLIGNEVQDNQSESYTMSGTDFTLPGWNNMSNTKTQTADYGVGHDRTVGFFGNLSVDYLNMLFFNATGRYDIVSTMPRGNRSFFYPSASLSFLFTELEPLKNNNILSFGKLRASYAEVGQPGRYVEPVYVAGGAGSGFLSDGISYPLGGITGYQPSSTIYDPNLKPQNTQSYEFGVELKFFKNRLGIDYNYFDQTARNQIFTVPLAGSTGYSGAVMNAGKMTSKGHEIVLTATPVQMNNFEWNMQANFTKIVNKCVELAPGVEDIFLGGYVTPNIRASAGDTYPAIYGERFLRDDQGRILVDDDPTSYTYGMPIVGEFGKIGEVSPDFMVGFNTSFTFFKNFTLSAQIDWKQGGQMYSGSNRLMDLYGSSKKTEEWRLDPDGFIWPGYKSDGTPNDIVRGGPNDVWAYPDLFNDVLGDLSEAHIYETSFVKLREVALGITLPEKWVNPILVKRATVSFVARNILLWTTLPNFDPETSQGQGNQQGGFDYMSLPQTTSYGFTLNLTF